MDILESLPTLSIAELRKVLSDNDIKDVFKNLKYRNVGPTRGGRVTTVHGVDSQKNIFYMGTTGGGVWKTSDFGNNWENISEYQILSQNFIREFKNKVNWLRISGCQTLNEKFIREI